MRAMVVVPPEKRVNAGGRICTHLIETGRETETHLSLPLSLIRLEIPMWGGQLQLKLCEWSGCKMDIIDL